MPPSYERLNRGPAASVGSRRYSALEKNCLEGGVIEFKHVGRSTASDGNDTERLAV